MSRGSWECWQEGLRGKPVQIRLCLVIQPVFVVQSVSHVRLFDPMDYSTPGSLVRHYIPELKFTSIESEMPSNHLILCCPLLF